MLHLLPHDVSSNLRSNPKRQTILHTRDNQYGAGHTTALIEQAQAGQAKQGFGLKTAAAACHTWYALLLFLRNFFSCDETLAMADIPRPAARPAAGAHNATEHQCYILCGCTA